MQEQNGTAAAARAGRRDLLKAGAAGAAIGALGMPHGAAAQRRGGGRIVFANGSAYDTMDPHVTFDVGRVAYRLNCYDSLLRWLDTPPSWSRGWPSPTPSRTAAGATRSDCARA